MKLNVVIFLLLGLSNAFGQSLSVLDFSPARFSMTADTLSTISVTLDQAVNTSAFDGAEFIVYGDMSGYKSGTTGFSNNDRTIQFTPSTEFFPSERVTVLLLAGLSSQSGQQLTNTFQWSFNVRTGRATNVFNLHDTNSVGNGPQSIVVRDFNGDRIPDFAATKSRDHNIDVWQNDGAAIFSSLDRDDIGDTPRGITSADFDRDGDFDLAAVNEVDATLSVLLNDNGEFSGSATLGTGAEPAATLHGDLDGDGWLDLATVNDTASTISVLLNDGTGGFLPQVEYDANEEPLGLAIDDIDNDGDADIVVSNKQISTVSILINDGSAGFTVSQSVAVPNGPRAIATGDFNQDGWVDIAVGSQDDNSVSLLLSAAGSFSNVRTTTAGTEPFALNVGDLDGDLDADVVVSNRKDGNLNIMTNDGTGTLASGPPLAAGAQPRGLAIGDLDDDQTLDIIVANWEDNEVKVFLNTADTTSLPVNQPPQAPAVTSPANNILMNPGAAPISLSWNVPVDADGDSLHFKVEISADINFSTIAVVGESNVNPAGFTPAMPVPQTSTVASYSFPNSLEDGTYWWRVTAFDGTESGPASSPGRFRLDTTGPLLQLFSVSAPDLQPNWFNPNATDSITLNVQFSDNHARRIDFNLGALANAASLTNIPSGPNQTASLRVPITEAADGTYSLTSTIVDSVGLSTFSTADIRLDATPPSGTTASSPAVSNEESFTVNWQTTVPDEGVGLSGRYDVRMKVDDGAWQDWRQNFAGESDTFSGANGSSYSFEAAAYDLLGNREAFTGTAETTTTVDTTSEDLSAPGTPSNLLIDGLSTSTWKKSPAFSIAWQPPTDRSGITKVYYKLGAAPTSNTDFTSSAAGSSSLNVNTSQENGQQLHIWLEDGVGNADYRNRATILLKYDGTAPVIDSLVLVTPQAEPNWFNPSISAQANLEVYFTEQNLQGVTFESDQISGFGNTSDGKTTFTLDLSPLGDGVYPLLTTVRDSAGNTASLSTSLGIDGTPPTGTVADSPDTSNTADFLVSWDNSGSDGTGSGLSGRFDIRFRVDGGTWQTWQTNFTGTSSIFEDAEYDRSYEFEIAAYDRAGNLEAFSGLAETATIISTDFVDAEPPQLGYVVPGPSSAGAPFTVRADLQDNIQILSATLYYHAGGDTAWQSIPLAPESGTLYQAVVPGDEFSSSGLVYYLVVSDGTNETYAPENWLEEPYYVPATIQGSNSQGLASPVLPSGTTASAYKMISTPLHVSNASPEDVLTDDFGIYDAERWRLFEYDSETGSYNEFPNISDFIPGKAFWLILDQPDMTFDTGTGESYQANKPFTIALKQGWNDIAVPFGFAVDWDVMNVPAGVMGPYTFDNSWILPTNVSTMFPWEGYSVFSPDDNLTISIPPIRSAATANVNASKLQKLRQDVDWQVELSVVSDKAQDLHNIIGVSQISSDTWDRRDYLEPPSPGGFLSLRFPHDDWNLYRGNFTTDFRKHRDDGYVWHFEVLTDLPDEPVRLNLHGIEKLPSGFEVRLIDQGRAELVDAAASGGYEFKATSGTRAFDLVIGTPEFIGQAQVVQEVTPKTYALEQNFPNPFNAGTTIKFAVPQGGWVEIGIYNLLGQKIKTLVSGEMKPGKYTFNWNARDVLGREVSSGVYIIHMSAGDFRQTKRALLLR